MNESPQVAIGDTHFSRMGATPVSATECHFHLWAPFHDRIEVLARSGMHSGNTFELPRRADGYFRGILPLRLGDCYLLKLDDNRLRPDPVSYFQPEGVHGPTQVVDPDAYAWSDLAWPGLPKRELVIYEMHLGSFTQDGNYHSALERLPELLDLGITAIELLPLAQCPGRRNWGYDGVNLYAPSNVYGEPDKLKHFVDQCHAMGIAVILDVVYNHLGPEGNYLRDFGPYFSDRHRTPWGEAFNFDQEDAGPVRQYIVQNALYWIREFHFDGLRLDAIHFLKDDSQPSIQQEVRQAVAKLQAQQNRFLHLIGESNVYDRRLLSPEIGLAYDAIWCDCLMHSVYSHGVANLRLTQRNYSGADDVAKALQLGFLYQHAGDGYERTDVGQEHVIASTNEIESLVVALQTHDAVGNHPAGKRLHQLTSLDFQKAAAALFLLNPSIPMIFMGEEWASDTPFPFFVDFEDTELAESIDCARAEEYPQHQWADTLSPSSAATFEAAKCHNTSLHHKEVFTWYRRLLVLRRQGIETGWLRWKHRRVTCDPAGGYFRVDYVQDDHRIEVHVALLSSEQQQGLRRERSAVTSDRKRTIALADGDRVLADSQNQDTESSKQVALGGDHALIIRRAMASANS